LSEEGWMKIDEELIKLVLLQYESIPEKAHLGSEYVTKLITAPTTG
jgi:hypothetical protein